MMTMRHWRALIVCTAVLGLVLPATGRGQDWDGPGGAGRPKSKSGFPELDFKGEINPCSGYRLKYRISCGSPRSAESRDCKQLKAYIDNRCSR